MPLLSQLIRISGVIIIAILMLFLVLNLHSPTVHATTSWSATLEAEDEPGGDEYGYEYGDFGDIDDRTFQHNGETHTLHGWRQHQPGHPSSPLRTW